MGGRSSGPSMRVRCYRCRQIGHLSKNCPQGRGAMFSRETAVADPEGGLGGLQPPLSDP